MSSNWPVIPPFSVFSIRPDIRQPNPVSDRILDIKKGRIIRCIPNIKCLTFVSGIVGFPGCFKGPDV
jgi:hypothetical protein